MVNSLLIFGVPLSTQWRRQTIGSIVKYARLAETCGFQYLWTSDESYIGEKDAFVLLSVIATETKRIKLGPYGTNPYIRDPATLATTLVTLNHLSKGRATLALGRGSRRRLANLGIEQQKPITKLREAIEVIKELTSGKKITYQGKTVMVNELRIIGASGDPIPIYAATVGPQTLEMAGAVADGVILVTAPTEYLEYAMERVKVGAKSAYRNLKGFDIALSLPCFIAEDYDKAFEEAKRFADFIVLVPSTIPTLLEKAGFSSTQIDSLQGHVDRFSAWFSKEQALPEVGKRLELVPEDVRDKIVNELAIVGTPADCIKRIKRYMEKGLTQMVLAPWTRDIPGWLHIVGKNVLPAFQT